MDQRSRTSRNWILGAAVVAMLLAGLATYSCSVPGPEGSGLDASEAVPAPTTEPAD